MIKTYEEQNFTDDFLFCKILMNHPKLCKELLEIILGIKIREITYLNKQESIEITSDGKGIRLDVYVEDSDNTVYDIEMQTVLRKDLPKRSRYYQGMIDLNLIERGARYSALKKSIVIFICLDDPFKKGLKIYHFSNRCHELPELELGDDTTKIFLNAKGVAGEVSEELQNLLNYVAARRIEGKLAEEIEREVQKARNREEWRLEYMTLLQRDLENREEGLAEGLAKGRTEGRTEERIHKIQIMIRKGYSKEDILDLEYTQDEYTTAEEMLLQKL